MLSMNPTALRKDLFNTLKGIVVNHSEVEVTLDSEESVVLVSKKDYQSLKELVYLQSTGVLDLVLTRMDNEKPNDFNIEDAL